jgi:hypothetical protein
MNELLKDQEARGGGRVNGSQLNFFHRIWPMPQFHTQAMFIFKNMMNTLTNKW